MKRPVPGERSIFFMNFICILCLGNPSGSVPNSHLKKTGRVFLGKSGQILLNKKENFKMYQKMARNKQGFSNEVAQVDKNH